jgi:hypothetical protein
MNGNRVGSFGLASAPMLWRFLLPGPPSSMALTSFGESSGELFVRAQSLASHSHSFEETVFSLRISFRNRESWRECLWLKEVAFPSGFFHGLETLEISTKILLGKVGHVSSYNPITIFRSYDNGSFDDKGNDGNQKGVKLELTGVSSAFLDKCIEHCSLPHPYPWPGARADSHGQRLHDRHPRRVLVHDGGTSVTNHE